MLADLVDGVLHLALDHASQGKPEGVVVVEVLGVVDEQLNVGREEAPRRRPDVLACKLTCTRRCRTLHATPIRHIHTPHPCIYIYVYMGVPHAPARHLPSILESEFGFFT